MGMNYGNTDIELVSQVEDLSRRLNNQDYTIRRVDGGVGYLQSCGPDGEPDGEYCPECNAPKTISETIVELTSPSIEDQIKFLFDHGWKRAGETRWQSPDGEYFIGPHGAYVLASVRAGQGEV